MDQSLLIIKALFLAIWLITTALFIRYEWLNRKKSTRFGLFLNKCMIKNPTEEFYVLVCENDAGIDRKDGRPIVFEQYLDNGIASFENVQAFQLRLKDKYGKTRIAKLQFVAN
jgi:hypothetical protein